jgi:ubiquitin-protein ligase
MTRLLKEIKLLKESKELYIDISDQNIKEFKVMFFGPEDSIFYNGVFVFEFIIPESYPFDPPKVKFLTGGIINARIHPNLYKEGKCCLSILNTWGKNEWSPLLTIEKVILTIKGILDNNPLSHEPSFEKTDDTFYKIYSEYYSLKSIPTVYEFYKNQNHPFEEIIKNNTIQNIKNIIERLEKLSEHNNKSYRTIHHSNLNINIESIKHKILEI